MEDQIFTPQEAPTLDDVMNTEQEDVVYTPLDNVIDDEIHTQTEPSDVQIPESEEIETGEPIEVTIEDQIITPKKNRIDFQGYELDNISEADNENDVPSIKQVRDIVEEVESEKQDKLTAGDNITITGNVISATDTTYTAGDNISISDENVISATDTTYTAGTNISISDENVISATDTTYTAGTNISISDDNVISATDTTYSAGSGITLTDTTFSIGNKAITTSMIDDEAVTNGKIDWSSVKAVEVNASDFITMSTGFTIEQPAIYSFSNMVFGSFSVKKSSGEFNSSQDKVGTVKTAYRQAKMMNNYCGLADGLWSIKSIGYFNATADGSLYIQNSTSVTGCNYAKIRFIWVIN